MTIQYIQDTNSKIIYKLPEELEYFLPESNRTSSSIESIELNRFIAVDNICSKAQQIVQKHHIPRLVVEANIILSLIKSHILSNIISSIDYTYLPPIHAISLEEGPLILEWAVDRFRLGITLEENNSESTYFLVSDKSAGDIQFSGYLNGIDLNSLILSLLILIINNL